MTHKAFEVIGKRVVIRDEIDNLRLIKFKKIIEERLDLIYFPLDRPKTGDSVKPLREKLGIFQENELFGTTSEGFSRSALDFIEPIYDRNLIEEIYTKFGTSLEMVNSRNPILFLHLGVDTLKLNYLGEKNREDIFEGELSCKMGAFYNEGNFCVYNKYKEPLKKAGFKI